MTTTTTYITYPYKSNDRGTVFGPGKASTTRKQAARDRNDFCRESSANARSWNGAITYTPTGTTKQQTQPGSVV